MSRKVKEAIIWATVADAAKVLTTSYVITAQAVAWHSTKTATEMRLLIKGAGTDPTSIDLIVEASPDGGTTGTSSARRTRSPPACSTGTRSPSRPRRRPGLGLHHRELGVSGDPDPARRPREGVGEADGRDVDTTALVTAYMFE